MSLRIRLLCAAAAVGLAGPAAAQEASPFSRVVVFGDSISDGGAYAAKAPAGAGSFTTNPDPIWVETIAAGLGLDLTPRAAGGTNYAEGGARVAQTRPIGPGGLTRKPVVNQVDSYLADGGVFGRDTLVIIQGGGNDVFFTQSNGLDFTDADLAVLDNAAQALADQLRRIDEAGEATIVTTSVPRFEAFNSRYEAKIGASGANVLFVDIAGLIAEIEANPGEFGIVNVTDPACRGSAVESFTCLPDSYVTPDANRTYLFADGVHFTGVVHEIEAGAVLAALRAPNQVGQLPLAAQATLQGLGDTLATQFAGSAVSPRGAWTVFGAAQGDWLDLDAGPRATGLESDGVGAAFGAEYGLGGGVSLGAALSWTEADADFGQDTGGYEARTLIAAVFARAVRGPFELTADAAYGGTAFDDVERRVALGPAERIETGDTDGKLFAAGVEAAFAGGAGPLRLRPTVGVRYEKVKVDGYGEQGERSTRMVFGDQTLETVYASLGAELTWATDWGVRPFSRASYRVELKDDAPEMWVMAQGSPVPFTTETYRPDGDYLAYAVGVAAPLQGGLTAVAGVSGTAGRGDLSTTAFRVGVQGRF